MSLQSHPGLESQRVPGELLAQVAILDKLDLRPISAMGCMNLPARVRASGRKVLTLFWGPLPEECSEYRMGLPSRVIWLRKIPHWSTQQLGPWLILDTDKLTTKISHCREHMTLGFHMGTNHEAERHRPGPVAVFQACHVLGQSSISQAPSPKGSTTFK